VRQGLLLIRSANRSLPTLTINGKSGAIGRRSVCVDYLYYLPDGKMAFVEQTKASVTVKPDNFRALHEEKTYFYK
jgi:hypothetical protein